jgi:uncharacterized membrane protein
MDTDSKRRAMEINEWKYNSTMETLFVLQLTFLAIAFTVILLVLSKYGIVSKLYAIYTGATILAFFVIIGVIKQLYTKNIRDTRNWNERRFRDDHNIASLVPPAVLSAASSANQQVCNAVKGTNTSTTPVTISCP